MPDRAPTAGARLRAAVEAERPLQVIGTINAYAALLAERAGFRALYLSGAGVANASFGLPDLGVTTLNDVCEDVRRITGRCALPLLVDAILAQLAGKKNTFELIVGSDRIRLITIRTLPFVVPCRDVPQPAAVRHGKQSTGKKQNRGHPSKPSSDHFALR